MSEQKARAWTAVLYRKSMNVPVEDMDEMFQCPGFYIVHDKDTKEDGTLKDEHVHVCIVKPGGITYKKALEIFNEVGTVNKVERVKGISFIWEYFIHNTEKAKKQGKHLYDESERITFNGFKITENTEASPEKREEIERELCRYVVNNKISNFIDLYAYAVKTYGEDGHRAVSSRSGFLERLTRGNYLKKKARIEEFQATGRRWTKEDIDEEDKMLCL